MVFFVAKWSILFENAPLSHGDTGTLMDNFSNNTHSALFFESYSLSQCFLLKQQIEKSHCIYFLDETITTWEGRLPTLGPMVVLAWVLRYPNGRTLKKMLISKFIQFCNPKTKIITLSYEDFSREYYQSNQTCLDIIQNLEPEILSSSPYKLLYSIIKDPNLILYYKSSLARVLPSWMLYVQFYQHLARRHSKCVPVVDGVAQDYSASFSLTNNVPKGLFTLNRYRLIFKASWVFFLSCITPFLIPMIYFRNGLGHKPRKCYDLATPIIWGFYDNTTERVAGGVKRPSDDSYFYGDGLIKGNVLHIFGDWELSPQLVANFKKVMQDQDIPFADKDQFKINIPIILNSLRISLTHLLHIFPIWPHSRFTVTLLYFNIKAIFHQIKRIIEFENISYKIEYVRNDYNPAHIINTILAHQRDRKVVGMAHACSSFDAPQVAFAHFDRYFSLCDIYVKTFGKYWENKNIVQSGRESMDWLRLKIPHQGEIHQKIDSLYGKKKYIVTITLPGPSNVCLPQSFYELYKGLCALKDIELDCHIFVRVRSMEYLQHPKLAPFSMLPQHDSRFILDHGNFDTFELISASDMVIAGATSWVINEAIAIGKKVFTFAYTNKEDMYFPNYGRDFILKTASDVLKIFSAMPDDFSRIDCHWDLLYKDADHFHDGRNCQRIRNTIVSLLE